MTSQSEINHAIKLVFNTAPIAKVPYKLSFKDNFELDIKLKYSLTK